MMLTVSVTVSPSTEVIVRVAGRVKPDPLELEDVAMK